MADRGDIVRALHKLSERGGEPFDPSRLAIHDPDAPDPVIGRLGARGLHEELRGSAYVVIDGVDGRRHHLRFTDLERTGDALPGAIVEARTWLDRQLVGRSTLAANGFGGRFAKLSIGGRTIWWTPGVVAGRAAP